MNLLLSLMIFLAINGACGTYSFAQMRSNYGPATPYFDQRGDAFNNSAENQPHYFMQATGDEMTLAKVRTLISEERSQTIDAFLASVSRRHKTWLQNYIVMVSSNSLQVAEPKAPRILLYSSNAKLILTFNGKPSQRGYDRLEVMEYIEAESRFEFSEIFFSGDRHARNNYLTQEKLSTDDLEAEELSIKLQEVRYSGKNPSQCLTCHRPDPRPNWESYFRWPGALVPRDQFVFKKSSGVEHAIADYSKTSNSPRYRWLKSGEDIKGQQIKNLVTLSESLSFWNMQRLARRLVKVPNFEQNFDAIADLLNSDVIPEDWKVGYAEVEAQRQIRCLNFDKSMVILVNEIDRQYPEATQSLDDPRGFCHNPHNTKIIFIAEKLLGLGLDMFEMSFARGAREFTTPSYAARMFLSQLIDASGRRRLGISNNELF